MNRRIKTILALGFLGVLGILFYAIGRRIFPTGKADKEISKSLQSPRILPKKIRHLKAGNPLEERHQREKIPGFWIHLVDGTGKALKGPFEYRWKVPKKRSWSPWKTTIRPQIFLPETRGKNMVLEVKGQRVLRERGFPTKDAKGRLSFPMEYASFLRVQEMGGRKKTLAKASLEPLNFDTVLSPTFSPSSLMGLVSLGQPMDCFAQFKQAYLSQFLKLQQGNRGRKLGKAGEREIRFLWHHALGESLVFLPSRKKAKDKRAQGNGSKEVQASSTLWKLFPGIPYRLSFAPIDLLERAHGKGCEIQKDPKISLVRNCLHLRPLHPGETRELALQFASQTEIRGSIPLPRAGVYVLLGSEIPYGWGTENVATTDAKGRFRFSCLPGKKYLQATVPSGKDPIHLRFYCEEFTLRKGEIKTVLFKRSYQGPYALYFRIEDDEVNRLLASPQAKALGWTRDSFRPLLHISRMFFGRKSIRDWTPMNLYPRLGKNYLLEGIRKGQLIGTVFYPPGSFPKELLDKAGQGKTSSFLGNHIPLFKLDFPEKDPAKLHLFRVRGKRGHSPNKPIHIRIRWLTPSPKKIRLFAHQTKQSQRIREGQRLPETFEKDLSPGETISLPAGDWEVFASDSFPSLDTKVGRSQPMPLAGEKGRGGHWGFLRIHHKKGQGEKTYDLKMKDGVFLLGQIKGIKNKKGISPLNIPFSLAWTGYKGTAPYLPLVRKQGHFFVTGLPSTGKLRIELFGESEERKGKLISISSYKNGARKLEISLPKEN